MPFPFSPAVRSNDAWTLRANDAVALLVHHNGPGDPGHFVRQRNGDDTWRLLRQQFLRPGVLQCAIAPREAKDRCCSNDEEHPQIAVAHLRYAAEPLLTT